jgi:DNA-binding LacI/PurR family transcriptional regulator
MADIARLAGVSIGSVSRALSGSKEVSEQTRGRVLELAKSLNYSVNAGASNLRRGRSRTISVVCPLVGEESQHLTDPFLWGLVGCIAERLTQRGYRMLLSRVPFEEMNVTEDVETGAAEGLIFTGQWLAHQKMNEMAMAGIPFTVWGAERQRQIYSSVGTDNRKGGFLATEHLFEQGARKIAFVGEVTSDELRLRHLGYLDAHQAHGIAPSDDLLLSITFDSTALRLKIRELWLQDQRFDGVFAASDMSAIAVMSTLAECGADVPRDVMVVGYDDVPAAALVSPGLSTIRQPLDLAAIGLVDGLLEQISGHQPANVLLPCELVRRGSSTRK